MGMGEGSDESELLIVPGAGPVADMPGGGDVQCKEYGRAMRAAARTFRTAAYLTWIVIVLLISGPYERCAPSTPDATSSPAAVMPANHLFLNIVFSFGNENRPLDARQRPRLRPIVAIRARRVARLSNQIAADRSIHAVCDEACRVS